MKREVAGNRARKAVVIIGNRRIGRAIIPEEEGMIKSGGDS